MDRSSVTLPPFVARYGTCFERTWTDDTPIESVRFVVLDSETTGLNPRTDRIITIGAVAVRDGDIILDDSFDALLQIARNTSAVTVHGITRDETVGGLEEPEALEQFLDYLKDGVIVGHHIGHDVQMLNAGYERHFGFEMKNRALDTMDLTLHLNDDGAFKGRAMAQDFTLDALCDMWGIAPHDRHTAGGDALITALVFQRLLRYATKVGRVTLGAIAEVYPVG